MTGIRRLGLKPLFCAMVWPTFGSIECLDAALFCLCFTLSGMHGIYRRVWTGDREITAWVRNRDRLLYLVDEGENVRLSSDVRIPLREPDFQTSSW